MTISYLFILQHLITESRQGNTVEAILDQVLQQQQQQTRQASQLKKDFLEYLEDYIAFMAEMPDASETVVHDLIKLQQGLCK